MLISVQVWLSARFSNHYWIYIFSVLFAANFKYIWILLAKFFLIIVRLSWLRSVADPDHAFVGGSQIRGHQKGLHLLKYQTSATIVGCHTKTVNVCRTRKRIFLLTELCNFPGNNHSLKAFYLINSGNVKRFPNSGPHFSQATHIWYICKMYVRGIKACCALVFATVLAICSEISEEQGLKCISDLVRSRTVLFKLGSDKSCPTIGLK